METFFTDIAVAVAACAVFGIAAYFTHQPLIVAYVFAGFICGPHFSGLVHDLSSLGKLAEVGVAFLLFLIGLVLNPNRLRTVFREVTLSTLASTAAFFAAGFLCAILAGLAPVPAAVVGIAATFSSTILTIKLLPVRKLHESPVGTLCVGVLILQDIIAIAALLFIQGYAAGAFSAASLARTFASGALIVIMAFALERWALRRLLRRFERYPELVFVTGLGWCLAFAEIAAQANLSIGIGAFVAGVAMARNPLSVYISEKVQPVRDFLIILFFFTIGAEIDSHGNFRVLLWSVPFAILVVVGKPWFFGKVLGMETGKPALAGEAGVRLGQLSEFSLLIAAAAFASGIIGAPGTQFITVATVLSIVISTYITVYRLPTPIGVRKELKQA